MATDIQLGSIQFALSTHHQLVIDKFPGVQFFCNKVSLPGLSIGNIEQPNPFSAQLLWAGEKTIFEPLPITFLIDEELNNYFEIADWIIDMGTPVEDASFVSRLTEPRVAGEGVFSDITILTQSNARNPVNAIKFVNAFPVALEQIDYETGGMSSDAMNATVTFMYERYYRERLPMHPETR